jgi:hypothetical protein
MRDRFITYRQSGSVLAPPPVTGSYEVDGFENRRSGVSSKRFFLLGVLLAVAAAILVTCAVRLGSMAEDDSFIHRRIAINLQNLGEPYFNPGQRVMVTSSPVWIMLLTGLREVLRIANPAPFLDVFFILVSAATAYLVLETVMVAEDKAGRLFPVLAFALVCVGLLPALISQMETPLAIALILAGVLGVVADKPWGMPLLVLACFTRYECVLLCAGAGSWVTLRRRWTRWSLFACVAIVLLGSAWLLREYGTVIPNTVIAKSHLYALSYRQVLGMLLFSQKASLVLFPVLGVVWWFRGRDRLSRPGPAVFFLAGFGTLLGLAYIVRKTFVFAWYLPLVWLPIALGVLLWTNRRRSGPAITGALFAAMLLFPFAMLDVRLLLAAVRGAPGSVSGFPLVARVHTYRKVGAALNGVCPAATLMTSEIGGLGWEFHGKILDAAGLASPEAIRYHPMRIPEERSTGDLGEIPAGFVRERRPDLIVSYDFFMESALPAARQLGYIDYSYRPFIPEDSASMKGTWRNMRLHVLVAPDGHCSPADIDQSLQKVLEK